MSTYTLDDTMGHRSMGLRRASREDASSSSSSAITGGTYALLGNGHADSGAGEYALQRVQDLPQVKNAVEIKALDRNFGSVKVLRGLTMTVPSGAIYGLLGPSGCGKTTLLKCILGALDIHGGSLSVFGRAPGDGDHPIPGPAVGFMPQDLALEPEFSIAEVLQYYAKLYGMDQQSFIQRKDMMLEFLDMPPQGRLIRNLSGGQKRRVSLCVALLHQPKLLILDEPTVGVDPLLRSRIWEYLGQIAESGCSVIITTHYIEEARQADRVGMMRNGHLLAEGNPNDLMEEYKQGSLEDVFLDLCTSQDHANDGLDNDDEDSVRPPSKELNPPPLGCWKYPPRRRQIGALMWRGYKRMRRNLGFIIFQFFMPAFQVILFCLAIGQNPEHLNFSVVNEDAGGVGQLITNALGQGSAFNLNFPPTYPEARRTVHRGDSWGALLIPRNFTAGLLNHTVEPMELSLDMTNQQISLFIESRVSDSFQSVAKEFHQQVSIFKMDPPVYGPTNPKFTDFIAPGMIIAISFAQAIGLTAISFVMDRKAGLTDRIWAAGVRPTELLLSHVFTQFFLLLIQILILLFFALVVFDLPMVGNFFLVVALSMVLGFCGMVYGLLISATVEDAEAANQAALGSFFPVLLLSGIIWPTQAIPVGLRYISLALPTTWSAEAMRSIMSRGWGVYEQDVWEGFAITAAWTFVLFVFSLRGVKSRKA